MAQWLTSGVVALWELFRPDLYLDSIYDIDWDKLRKRGIRALILDLDNTLLAWRTAQVHRELREWAGELKGGGFSACLVSNNFSGRVSRIAQELGIPHLSGAGKPRRGAFIRAMKLIGSKPEETAVMGDQVFTDVLGGNRLGLFTILVVPVSDHEFFATKMVRVVERWVLRRLAKRDPGGEPG